MNNVPRRSLRVKEKVDSLFSWARDLLIVCKKNMESEGDNAQTLEISFNVGSADGEQTQGIHVELACSFSYSHES
jgi:hypothetical protein